MNEEQKQLKPNDDLTNRVNNAYIAKSFTLLNGGTDNILMVRGDRDDKDPVNILMTYEEMKEVLESLASSTVKIEENKKTESDGNEK